MTDTGLVLSLFSVLAVLAVGAILGGAIWTRARSTALESHDGAVEGDPMAANHWFTSDEDGR